MCTDWPLHNRWTDEEKMLATGSRENSLKHPLMLRSAYAGIPVRYPCSFVEFISLDNDKVLSDFFSGKLKSQG